MTSITSNFSQFSSPMKMYDKSSYDTMVNWYAQFTGKNHDFRKVLARQDAELSKLKAAFSNNNNPKLAEIIQRKEESLRLLQQFSEQVRDGYFSTGETKAQQVDAYLKMTGN